MLPASHSSFPTAIAGIHQGQEMASATVTLTQQVTETTTPDVLRLSLSRPSVRWDENVVDNEGLGKKSSKRCCIFHKQRAFGESSTDSSDQEDDGDHDGNGKRKIARPKNTDNIPAFQRYHA